jgi:3-hexulose-6-phosphate synthase
MGIIPSLQVAIDDPATSGLPALLKSLAASTVDYVEIGTPFLTAYGVHSLEIFRVSLPLERIYVDLKCIDLWEKQIIPFILSGAKNISIHALLEPMQAKALINYATHRGINLFVSNLGLPDKLANQLNLILYNLGYRNFVMHGEGMTPESAIERARKKKETSTLPADARTIIAGGIDSTRIKQLRYVTLDGVIVGRGITASPEPLAEVKRLKELLVNGW